MSDVLTVFIDLTEAGLELDPEQLEKRSRALADELESGELVEFARLTRETDGPEGSKSGLLAFVGGVLTTEITKESLKATLDFLGNRFYGKTLTLTHGDTAIEYRNAAELDQALAAVERLEALRIQVKEA